MPSVLSTRRRSTSSKNSVSNETVNMGNFWYYPCRFYYFAFFIFPLQLPLLLQLASSNWKSQIENQIGNLKSPLKNFRQIAKQVTNYPSGLLTDAEKSQALSNLRVFAGPYKRWGNNHLYNDLLRLPTLQSPTGNFVRAALNSGDILLFLAVLTLIDIVIACLDIFLGVLTL